MKKTATLSRISFLKLNIGEAKRDFGYLELEKQTLRLIIFLSHFREILPFDTQFFLKIDVDFQIF